MKSKYFNIFSFVFLTLVVSASLLTFYNLQTEYRSINSKASSPTVTFTPAAITSGEVANPLRGAQYYGNEQTPPGMAITNFYWRGCWNEIEPTENNYDFSSIDAVVSQAKAAGGVAGFRVMAVNPGQTCLPGYLTGLQYTSSQYLPRAQALFTALASHYANNPFLGWVDMSLYGCWGEWHHYCFGADNTDPMGTYTLAGEEQLINIETTAFPKMQFLMLTADQPALNYALNLSMAKPIGVRIDCLGDSGLGGAQQYLDTNTLENTRWQTAPFYFEYCGGTSDFATADSDVKNYRATMIGDGANNLNNFSSYSVSQQASLLASFIDSGYRFVLKSMILPSQITTNTAFSTSAIWENVNTAPTYVPWNVTLLLKNSQGTIIWQGKSQLNLETPFGLTPGVTKTVADTFTVPTSVAAGTYTAAISVMDPNKVLSPLSLAIQGRGSDGSYNLGNITVASGTQGTPTVTQAPTATPTKVVSPTATKISTPTATKSPTVIATTITTTPSPVKTSVTTTTKVTANPTAVAGLTSTPLISSTSTPPMNQQVQIVNPQGNPINNAQVSLTNGSAVKTNTNGQISVPAGTGIKSISIGTKNITTQNPISTNNLKQIQVNPATGGIKVLAYDAATDAKIIILIIGILLTSIIGIFTLKKAIYNKNPFMHPPVRVNL